MAETADITTIVRRRITSGGRPEDADTGFASPSTSGATRLIARDDSAASRPSTTVIPLRPEDTPQLVEGRVLEPVVPANVIERWAKSRATSFYATPVTIAGKALEWRHFAIPLSLFPHGAGMLTKLHLAPGELKDSAGSTFGFYGAIEGGAKGDPQFYVVILKDKDPGAVSAATTLTANGTENVLSNLSLELLTVTAPESAEVAYLRRWMERRAVRGRGSARELGSTLYSFDNVSFDDVDTVVKRLGGELRPNASVPGLYGINLKGEGWGVLYTAVSGQVLGATGIRYTAGVPGSRMAIQATLFASPAAEGFTAIPLLPGPMPAPTKSTRKRDWPILEIAVLGLGFAASSAIAVTTLGVVLIFRPKPKRRRRRKR